jgi:hypothetical protein
MNRKEPQMIKRDYKKGDLVRWFEYYADEILKNGGTGVIVSLSRQVEYYNIRYYNVLKQDTGNVEEFSELDLELFGDKEKK